MAPPPKTDRPGETDRTRSDLDSASKQHGIQTQESKGGGEGGSSRSSDQDSSRSNDGGNDQSSRDDRGDLPAPSGDGHGSDSMRDGSHLEGGGIGGGGGESGIGGGTDAKTIAEMAEGVGKEAKAKMEQDRAEQVQRNADADETNEKQRALLKGTASLP